MSAQENRRVDIGIVIRNPEPALAFYRDVLGLEHVEERPLSPGVVLHMLRWGNSLVKLMHREPAPAESNPPGGMFGGAGIRYITLAMTDIAGMVERCGAAGHRIAVPVTEIPGMTLAIVEDPEGNWVELLEA